MSATINHCSGRAVTPYHSTQNNFDFTPFQLVGLTDYEDYRSMWNLNSFRSQLRGLIEDEMGALMNRALEEEEGEGDQGGGQHFQQFQAIKPEKFLSRSTM